MGKRGQQQQAVRQSGGVLTASVDWLDFTVPVDKFYDLVRFLPGGLQPLDYGFRGYKSSALVGGTGRVAWSEDRPDMKVHVMLGSQALATLAGLDDSWKDHAGVLTRVRDDFGGNVTRLDVAWDDKTSEASGLLDLEVMKQAVADEAFTTRWRGGYKRDGWGNQSGDTVYFGSRRSDAMLRAYDKVEERIANNHADQVEGVGHWTRVELQLRRKRADVAAAVFQRVNEDPVGVFRFLAGVLRGYLEFKVPNASDSNKRRWEPAAWWLAFLGHVEKAKLTVEALVRTIQHVKDWLARSVAPSLALVEAVMGKDDGWAWLFRQTDEAKARWGPRHWAIVNAAKAT